MPCMSLRWSWWVRYLLLYRLRLNIEQRNPVSINTPPHIEACLLNQNLGCDFPCTYDVSPGSWGLIIGELEELYVVEPVHISASEPLLIGVIARSQDGKTVGLTDPADPSLYFLPPRSQYASEFYMPVFSDADGNPYQKAELIVSLYTVWY